jgi:hypothetical protein
VTDLIIGFGHRSRSGKDTAAAAIIEQRGLRPRCLEPWDGISSRTGTVGDYDIRRYGFGDELKREVTQAAISAGGMENLFGTWEFYRADGAFVELPQWVLEGYETNPDMSDPLCPLGKQRTLLQWWGTEYRRSVNQNYWVDKALKRIKEENPQIALITDVRFPNEFQCIKDLGEVVRIDRPSLPPLTKDAHISERALADVPDEEWSRVIVNDGTLEEFNQKAVEAFDLFMEYPKGYGHGV